MVAMRVRIDIDPPSCHLSPISTGLDAQGTPLLGDVRRLVGDVPGDRLQQPAQTPPDHRGSALPAPQAGRSRAPVEITPPDQAATPRYSQIRRRAASRIDGQFL